MNSSKKSNKDSSTHLLQLWLMANCQWAIALLLCTPPPPPIEDMGFFHHLPWNFHKVFGIFNHLHGNSTYLFDPFPWKIHYISLLMDHPKGISTEYFHNPPWNLHISYLTQPQGNLHSIWFY